MTTEHEDKSTDELARDIYSNHLPHIYERLGSLEGKIAVVLALAAGIILLVIGLYYDR